jgi:hypothetical protein
MSAISPNNRQAPVALTILATPGADADAAAAVRQRLVDSAHGVTWGHPTPSGYVVGPMHVWVPHDVAWGRWVACAELSPEEAVRADMALEAA